MTSPVLPQTLGVPMTAGAVAIRHVLPYQRDFFLQKFGREPQVNDPVFFDFQSSTMKPMPRKQIVSHLLQIMEQTEGNPLVINELRHIPVPDTYPDDLEQWLTGKSQVVIDFRGDIYPLAPAIYERIQFVQLDAYRRIYGKLPDPKDPIFFDPQSPSPQPYPTSASPQRIVDIVEHFLNTDINKPTLLEDLARITHPILLTLLFTVRDEA